MSIGRTIKIYLDDGSVTGIRHAEIVNWTGQAISSPRTQFAFLINWPESRKPGVYFLFGVDDETGNLAVYIGEAENVFERLQYQLREKDFWNEVVFFTSKDENLTKSHVKYLESRLIQIAQSANRYVILNSNIPQLPSLPRGDKDSMEEFIGNLKILLGTIGHKALEGITSYETTTTENIIISNQEGSSLNQKFILKIKGIDATAVLSDEGIVVLTGSTITENVKDSLTLGNRKLRDQLIATGVISKEDGKLKFTKDQLFTSPSQAAAIIVGYSINGRLLWQTTDGITLKEIEEKNGNT